MITCEFPVLRDSQDEVQQQDFSAAHTEPEIIWTIFISYKY